MYLRVSTFDQAHNGYGLGDQEVQCRKYIDLYFPNDEVKIYKDDGYSAKNLSRPEMKRISKRERWQNQKSRVNEKTQYEKINVF